MTALHVLYVCVNARMYAPYYLACSCDRFASRSRAPDFTFISLDLFAIESKDRAWTIVAV